jgi:hypothetical protein
MSLTYISRSVFVIAILLICGCTSSSNLLCEGKPRWSGYAKYVGRHCIERVKQEELTVAEKAYEINLDEHRRSTKGTEIAYVEEKHNNVVKATQLLDEKMKQAESATPEETKAMEDLKKTVNTLGFAENGQPDADADEGAIENSNINLIKQSFFEEYERIRHEEIESEGVFTSTRAAVTFVPGLDVAQPSLIQSFSLRNLFQYLVESWDPEDIRAGVSRDLLERGDQFKTNDSTFLKNGATLTYAVDRITSERIKNQSKIVRENIFSWDIGLAASGTIGGSSTDFDNRVDSDFPQFLFGGGVHIGAFELSVGTTLYRNNDDDFKTNGYFGLSIELFNTVLGASSGNKVVN